MNLILHATDGSEAAEKAMKFAVDMAKGRHAALLVLHVQRGHGADRIPPGLEEYERAEHMHFTEAQMLRGAAERIADIAKEKAGSMGVKRVESLVVEGDPAHQIVEVAKQKRADAIVLGSRGLGDAAGLLLGSVSHKVAHLAPCTCVIVR